MNPSSSESLLIARLQELPPAERSAFLQRACAADPALRGRLEAIGAALVADVGSGTGVKTVAVPADGPLEPNWAARAFETALDLGDAETPGVSIGPYKLLEKIGEGGFGVVWMAEQHEPIRRRVAVKIIKTGMDTEEVIARFEAERQALALMEHPNIARIFDAGATVSGRPYFVMELVRGSAITRYCDENRLPAEARLRLFVTVCQAVQHAHQKGVIHRDLKPSNILVTLHDGVPVPKIIDFGIAKATSARLTEKTLFTQFHTFIGTPAYTSPEQMEMSGLDVDTRTDIYSLGVLLYELLAGRPPFDADSLVKSGLEAMRRTIREIDPPRPSHRLNTLSEVNRASVAQQRGTDAAKLSLMLRGDLDWIAMRCLEKDRTRRYDSATALAADVERHLSDDPVEARPPNRLYQANKFVRRHKLAVAAVTAVAASLVAGLIASSFLLVRERAAHARALSAEQKETDLRQQAEVARASEVKRAARTALDLANRHLADGRIGEGLAYLVYAARKDPTNPTLAPRLAFTLAAYNFLLPLGTPFVCNSRVLALHYARDGRTLLCCTEDGTLRAIDAASGELRSQFRLGRPVNPGGWEFAEDNETVVGVRFPDNTFGIYGIPSGQPRFAPVQLDPRVWSIVENIGIGHPVRLSPDGRWLCAYAAKQFWLWDAASGQLRLNPEFSDGIFGFNFSADSRRLAVTIGNSVQQWQLPDFAKDSESIVFRKPGSSSPANVHFSPDGRLLAVCDAAQCKVFDAVTGVELQTLPKTSGKFYTASLAFTDARHVLAKLNTRCGLWDLDSGKFTTLPLPAGDNLVTVDFDATGQRGLATSSDGLTRVFNAGTGTSVTEPAWPQRAAFCAAISPDGTQATIGTAAGMIYRLRIGGGPARPLLLPRSLAPIKPGPIRPGDQATDMPTPFLRETPDRLLWLTASNAKVIDVASGAEVAGGYAYPEPILGMFYNRYPLLRSDLKFMLVQTQRYEWQSWELGRDGVQRAAALQEPPPSPGEIAFSASADLVALPTSDSFRVWNLRTGLPAGPRFTYPTNINGTTLNFSPDGKLLAFAGNDGAAIVVEVATSRPVGSFKTRPLVANSNVAFSPDGTRLVTLNVRNEMILWNPVTRAAIGPAVGGIGWGQHARFSPDSRWLASWSDNRVALWDGRTGAPVGQAIPAGGHTVIFSADGNRLATAEQEGNVQVWDVPSGEPVTGVLPLPTPTANLPEFSPDGRFLKIENDYFTVWSIPPRPASGTAPPEWLLQLATICSSQVVNDAGQLTDASAEASRISALRREIAALPADAPYAEWGRWVLDDRADRSIAPCFSVTAAEADKLAADLAAAEGKK